MLHIVGDSHVVALQGIPNSKTEYITSGPTAYNLVKSNSSSGSRERLFSVIDKMDKSKDSLLLSFGEIDCRLHIYAQYIKKNIPITDAIINTILRYDEVLQQLKGIAFHVLGIPPAGTEPNIYNMSVFASDIDRAVIHASFNTAMKLFCKLKEYHYIDVYSETVNEAGFIKTEYRRDHVHLTKRIEPYVIKMIGPCQ